MPTVAPSQRVVVPPREGRLVRVAAEQSLRVIDVEGGQVGDLFAFAADDPDEHLSASHTRAVTSRLFPLPGEAFQSDRRRPLLTLVEDDSPGVHDMLIAACDPPRYAALGAPGHASCAENLERALAAEGLAAGHVPQPVNLFMRIPVLDGADLGWLPAESAAGDSVTLRAERDLVVVLSACPQDLVGINAGAPTALAIELL
jgi:uncharacterized protein YcgI (DUF1989 family)